MDSHAGQFACETSRPAAIVEDGARAKAGHAFAQVLALADLGRRIVECPLQPFQSCEFRQVRLAQRAGHQLLEVTAEGPAPRQEGPSTHRDPSGRRPRHDVRAEIDQEEPVRRDAQILGMQVVAHDAGVTALPQQLDQTRAFATAVLRAWLERVTHHAVPRQLEEPIEVRQRRRRRYEVAKSPQMVTMPLRESVVPLEHVPAVRHHDAFAAHTENSEGPVRSADCLHTTEGDGFAVGFQCCQETASILKCGPPVAQSRFETDCKVANRGIGSAPNRLQPGSGSGLVDQSLEAVQRRHGLRHCRRVLGTRQPPAPFATLQSGSDGPEQRPDAGQRLRKRFDPRFQVIPKPRQNPRQFLVRPLQRRTCAVRSNAVEQLRECQMNRMATNVAHEVAPRMPDLLTAPVVVDCERYLHDLAAELAGKQGAPHHVRPTTRVTVDCRHQVGRLAEHFDVQQPCTTAALHGRLGVANRIQRFGSWQRPEDRCAAKQARYGGRDLSERHSSGLVGLARLPPEVRFQVLAIAERQIVVRALAAGTCQQL